MVIDLDLNLPLNVCLLSLRTSTAATTSTKNCTKNFKFLSKVMIITLSGMNSYWIVKAEITFLYLHSITYRSAVAQTISVVQEQIINNIFKNVSKRIAFEALNCSRFVTLRSSNAFRRATWVFSPFVCVFVRIVHKKTH